jgi:DNA-directed RNA polymerase delta subunit
MESENKTKEDKQAENNPEFSFYKAFNEVVSGFPERSQKIIKSRYGIEKKTPKTLEEIGRSYKITRERVRQIIQEALKKVKSRQGEFPVSQAKDRLIFTISQKSGIIRQEELISGVGREIPNETASARFFLDCFDDFSRIEAKGEIEKSYALPGFEIDEWRKIKNTVRGILEKENRLLSDDEIEIKILRGLGSKFQTEKTVDYLSVSQEIKKNSFGKWGLAHWEEVSPKNTRGKAYLVLKEAGQPLHFKKIAELIDKFKLNKKRTHFQTVHNELIKDERFVLIGRGIYALTEWGYEKGTVREILEEIFKKSKKPMSREQIINEVLKVRQVKKSTVVINLNNFFAHAEKK